MSRAKNGSDSNVRTSKRLWREGHDPALRKRISRQLEIALLELNAAENERLLKGEVPQDWRSVSGMAAAGLDLLAKGWLPLVASVDDAQGFLEDLRASADDLVQFLTGTSEVPEEQKKELVALTRSQLTGRLRYWQAQVLKWTLKEESMLIDLMQSEDSGAVGQSLPHLLKTARSHAGHTQFEAAHMIRINVKNYGLYERGRRAPKRQSVMRSLSNYLTKYGQGR